MRKLSAIGIMLLLLLCACTPKSPLAIEPEVKDEVHAPQETMLDTSAEPEEFLMDERYIDAYLEILKNEKNAIEGVGFEVISAVGAGRVAVVDICGDATPELLYTKQVGDTVYGAPADLLDIAMVLYIWTFEDGAANTILDLNVGHGGMWHYLKVLLLSNGELYIYNPMGQTDEYHKYSKYEIIDGALVEVSKFGFDIEMESDGTLKTTYWQNDATSSRHEYEGLEISVIDNVDVIAIETHCVGNKELFHENTADFKNTSLSYDQAVTYLNSLRTMPSSDADKELSINDEVKESDSVFSKEEAETLLRAHLKRELVSMQLEDEIVNLNIYDTAQSSAKYKGDSIYFFSFEIIRITGGNALVFSDGTIIYDHDATFARFGNYFDFDIRVGAPGEV